MKRILLPCVLALAVITSCDKDKFESTPTLKIKEAAPSVVDPNNNLYRVSLEFTDKEGDVFSINDSLNLSVFFQRINVRGPELDSLKYKVPPFPEKSKGEILLTIPWHAGLNTLFSRAIPLPGGAKEADTIDVGFVLKDTLGHRSDTPWTRVVVIRI